MDIFIYIFNIIATVNIDFRNLSYKLSSELNNLALSMLFIAISIVYYFLWTEKTLKKWESMLLLFYFGIYVSLKLLFFQQII